MDNRRLVLLLVFSFSLVMLWDGWQKHFQPKNSLATVAAPVGGLPSQGGVSASYTGIPSPVTGLAATADKGVAKAEIIKVETDLFLAEISSQGGDIVRLELKNHRDTKDKKRAFVLFDDGDQHFYRAQSGAIGEGLPNHRSMWRVTSESRFLKEGDSTLSVQLVADLASGKEVVKTYIFHRGSYQIDIRHEGLPAGAFAYYQFTRDGKPAEGKSNSMMMGASTFTGPAVFTEAEKFQKVSFSDITKNKAKFATKADNGWLAMVQHYFVAAWLPTAGIAREFYMRTIGDNLYSAGVILPVGADGKSSVSLYAGPQELENLKGIAPGFDLVVDYGWLTVIAAPLFWVLGVIHKLTGNWGWAIILLTVLIKLVFFPLSAASYKSMAKMRLVTPKLAKLKETYGDDKMRLNQEMMALYKKENINPLGGCLPILIQIPVFISLYWVLQGTVEMRNAPWIGWIKDLSAQDPYYVLPLLMGVTMFIQTKLNPAPPDPLQAKVMLMMPILFTGMFLFFPAGLVLYWTVNNLLSIAQQWQITRLIEAGSSKSA
ncbi:insertase [Rugosibacter aromaticivorans]|uniref:Membrane protein insertase YidC n=1 Tax=Rugosibacter aromaticivorans TaxID=1565605 RepID=A0A0C5JC01_9PROT|nr:membrane protein insertase YidC [Rugosibacter aromaticivorans]AJP49294.1 insertase [Rugosibacter aromaticivorans]TBR16537.1 MAG: membrane protein insertase YidC [Rugosibacter sp.]